MFPISSGSDEASCSYLTPLHPWSSTVLPPAPFSFSFTSPLPSLFLLSPTPSLSDHSPSPLALLSTLGLVARAAHCQRQDRSLAPCWLSQLGNTAGWELQGEPTYILEILLQFLRHDTYM